MVNLSELDLHSLINPDGFECSCGKRHFVDIKLMEIGKGAIRETVKAVNTIGSKHPLVVCGPNGYRVAGERVYGMLLDGGIDAKLFVVPDMGDSHIKPAEPAMGSLVLNFSHDRDMVLAVGSGVINDLCKVLSKIAKIPYMVVGTAPSMDGYTSASSSMEVNNVKLTLDEQAPSCVILDTDILAQAPMHMIHAGFGDIIAKYTALCEWQISNIATEEYYCENVAGLTSKAIKAVLSGAEGIPSRDPDAIQSIAEGLIISGIAMAFADTSHPASGLEHYFSHFREMQALERKEDCDLHGIQTGIGALLTLKIYKFLKKITPTYEHAVEAADNFDYAAWENEIKRVFSSTYEDILKIEASARKNDREGRLKRAERIISNWDRILSIIENTLPEYDSVKDLMEKIGAPTKPSEIGMSADDVIDAFVHSRDMRNKYLISSLIWDIGYMDAFAEMLREEL